MMIDLVQLSRRESDQIEWKENVADIDDVVETLSAFANDLSNLGGGYVVCGAREDKDENGFPLLVKTGLTANRLKEVEGVTLARCRERVSPSIAPLVEELPAGTPDKRILVFIQPATNQAHMFRRGDGGGKHFVRVSRSTIEARNGLLRDLLVRKGALETWDRRVCNSAQISDIDLLALRDALSRMGLFSPERGLEPYLSDDFSLSPFVPPLLVREPLTGVLRPRNFAILLFGRETQRFIPGAFSIFSMYPGIDRSDTHAERHEIAGNLLEQARRLTELLNVQSNLLFDKSDTGAPNILKYPARALYEAMGNALAHRDYEATDPTRITVFRDRIEVMSPGSLPLGVDPVEFREGRAGPRWRNQTLAWFFNRLQLAQAEGQGIPTILRVMRAEGCPPPTLDADSVSVLCVLPAHPRHAILQDLRAAEQSLSIGELERAKEQVRRVIDKDPLNFRALHLYAEIHQALREPEVIEAFVRQHIDKISTMPAAVLIRLAETLVFADRPPESARKLSQQLLSAASREKFEEHELRRLVVTMIRAEDAESALTVLQQHLAQHPEWARNASLLQLRGDAFLGLAKRCRKTAKSSDMPRSTKSRAWKDFHFYLEQAERDLASSLELSVDPRLAETVRRNLDFLHQLRTHNQPRRGAKK